MDQTEKKDTKAQPAAKNVKIEIKRDCTVDGKTIRPGVQVMVTEEVAKELCDRKYPGKHPFFGYAPAEIPGSENARPSGMPSPYGRQPIVKAVRVS